MSYEKSCFQIQLLGAVGDVLTWNFFRPALDVTDYVVLHNDVAGCFQ